MLLNNKLIKLLTTNLSIALFGEASKSYSGFKRVEDLRRKRRKRLKGFFLCQPNCLASSEPAEFVLNLFGD